MKNLYMVKDKRAVIFIDAPPDYDMGGCIEVYIDADDLELIKSFPGTWYAFVHKGNNTLYIRGNKQHSIPDGFTSKQPLLHRTIARPKKGQNTVFVNGDSLNCCKKNLANVPIGQTYTPQADPTKLPVVRGVHWRQDKNRFEVKAYHNKTGYYLGLYKVEDWEKANTAVEIFRRIGPEEYFKKYHKGATQFDE